MKKAEISYLHLDFHISFPTIWTLAVALFNDIILLHPLLLQLDKRISSTSCLSWWTNSHSHSVHSSGFCKLNKIGVTFGWKPGWCKRVENNHFCKQVKSDICDTVRCSWTSELCRGLSNQATFYQISIDFYQMLELIVSASVYLYYNHLCLTSSGTCREQERPGRKQEKNPVDHRPLNPKPSPQQWGCN